MGSFQDSSSAVDLDDNAFYEELTRQILMLTDEDYDDKGAYLNRATKLRRMPIVYGGVGSGLVGKDYYSWSEPERYVVPSWLESLWANGGGGGGGGGGSGGGTGVFIPSGGVTSRRGKKSGRRRYYNNKATKNNDKGRVYSTVVQKIHG